MSSLSLSENSFAKSRFRAGVSPAIQSRTQHGNVVIALPTPPRSVAFVFYRGTYYSTWIYARIRMWRSEDGNPIRNRNVFFFLFSEVNNPIHHANQKQPTRINKMRRMSNAEQVTPSRRSLRRRKRNDQLNDYDVCMNGPGRRGKEYKMCKNLMNSFNERRKYRACPEVKNTEITRRCPETMLHKMPRAIRR